MKSYDEMYELILKTATEDDRIRAVTMEGSNASEDALKDAYSDFDITFFVTDIREFTSCHDYMTRFGEVLILQCPDDWYEEPYDYTGRQKFTFLTQFTDGNRIDLTFIDVSNIETQKDFTEPRRVLINKDNFPVLKDITSCECFYITKPSEAEYFHACNEFRWLSNYATKGICREELPYVKNIMDRYMRDMFMKMLNWKIGIDNDFKVTTGAGSKYLKKYLTEDEMKRFSMIFAGGEYGDMQFKLFIFYDYFADLARYVADKLGFTFDEKETQAVREFMVKRFDELKARKNSGKQVLLLGDSLRMGYEPVVRKNLTGIAGVSGPLENGRWAGYTLNSLRFWLNSFPVPDVVHWNCGLWDLGDDYTIGRPFSLPEEYESAVERTVTVLNKLFPSAQIILATTMPTDNPDTSGIESYNEIIKRVAARHNLPVDDLFPLLRDNIGLIGPDHIHLKSEGYDLIGQAVTDIILKYL